MRHVYQIATCIGLFSSTVSWGKDRDFRNITPTISLVTSYGFTTFKSKLLEANDTGTALSYGIRGFAGKNSVIGFGVDLQSTSTSFEINNSSNSFSWQDSVIRYRWTYVYLGPLFSTMNVTANNQGTDIIDMTASGIGGNFGFLVPLGPGGSLYLDYSNVSYSKSVNSLTTTASAGARSKIDIGSSISLTQSLVDLMFGYKQETLTISTDSSYTETLLTTYIGVTFSLFF